VIISGFEKGDHKVAKLILPTVLCRTSHISRKVCNPQCTSGTERFFDTESSKTGPRDFFFRSITSKEEEKENDENEKVGELMYMNGQNKT
jgi:hypothetical protein